MAILELSKRMAFWKIKMDGQDFTPLLREVIESISVKRTILPPPKNSKKEHAPNEATISIISKNYLEDLFVEGTELEIYMGYDRILPKSSLVFKGVIPALPDGSAEEMLKYNILALGDEITLALEEKSHVFAGMTKAEMIHSIIDPYEFDITIDIDDTVRPMADSIPLQIAATDLEMLNIFAKGWDCKMWLKSPNKFFFIDANKYSKYQSVYTLNYRSDKTIKPNVENVTWKHEKPQSALVDSEGNLVSFNQLGEVKDIENYKIYALGKTWEISPETWAQINSNPDHAAEAGKIDRDILVKTLKLNAYNALHTYYRICDGGDNMKRISDTGEGSGIEVTVTLNEGDPDLYPPREALLYHGSINPRADSSHLPKFLSRWGFGQIWLNINETVLSYRNGKLDSELTCVVSLKGVK